jgi:hypothetical protein
MHPDGTGAVLRRIALGRTYPFQGEGGKVWNRRFSPVAVRPAEGPLTEPTAGAQPWRRELVFMPQAVLDSGQGAALHFFGGGPEPTLVSKRFSS